jgi:hypothetical protein
MSCTGLVARVMRALLASERVSAFWRSATIPLLLLACSGEAPPVVAPELPPAPSIPAAYRNAAFTLAVNAVRQQVTVSAPTASVTAPIMQPGTPTAAAGQRSLLGGDAIELVVTNYRSGAVGAVVPGKIQVLFDLQVINRLSTYRLSTPTFPTPPSGVTGLLAFPIEITVLASSGGVTTINNEVLVSSPRFGRVVHSNDWNGDLHNFFNDAGCPATATDCFRYEPFGSIEPLASSTPQPVGFLIDPEVGDFRVKVIVGADLIAAASPLPGTITGTVTSNIGPLEGAIVSVSGGGAATTSSTGAYTLSNVPGGNGRTLSLTLLPAGCIALQPTATVNVAAGATVTANFVADCPIPMAPVQGTVVSSLGGALVGVGVTITPTGGSPLTTAVTSVSGTWQVPMVPYQPSNSGTITLTNLPSGCTVGSWSYSGLTASGLVRELVVACTPAPTTYPLTATWGEITPTGPTGRQVTLTLSIDMGTAPGSSDVDGAAADALTGLSFQLTYNGTLLDWVSRQLLTSATFDIGDVVESGAGSSNAASTVNIASSIGATRPGLSQLIRLTFNVTEGMMGTVTPQILLTRIGAGTQDLDVTGRVLVNISSLSIP